jgi:hypothetical protein
LKLYAGKANHAGKPARRKAIGPGLNFR